MPKTTSQERPWRQSETDPPYFEAFRHRAVWPQDFLKGLAESTLRIDRLVDLRLRVHAHGTPRTSWSCARCLNTRRTCTFMRGKAKDIATRVGFKCPRCGHVVLTNKSLSDEPTHRKKRQPALQRRLMIPPFLLQSGTESGEGRILRIEACTIKSRETTWRGVTTHHACVSLCEDVRSVNSLAQHLLDILVKNVKTIGGRDVCLGVGVDVVEIDGICHRSRAGSRPCHALKGVREETLDDNDHTHLRRREETV